MDLVKEVTNPEDQQNLLDSLQHVISRKEGIDEQAAKQLRKAASNMAIAQEQGNDALDPKLSEAAQVLLLTLREKTHQQVERREQDFTKVMALLDQADQSLKDNELKAATQAVHKSLSILGTIPGLSEQRREKVDKRLNRIQPQMRKLESWRHWATSQARQDLIDQIKLLVGSRLHPKELAKTIEEARNQWRDWDQGGDHTKQKLWNDFDNACKAAFAPCKVYFDERKQARKQGLKQRQALINEINERFSAIEWKSPDYKEIDKWLRGKRRDFYKAESVDYKHRKKISAALDEALAQFETPLARERSRCFKTRQKLVADVEALATLDDHKAALDQLDALKKNWQVTVVEKRGLEDKLWKQYQKACDVLYAKRNSARKEQDAQFAQNLKDKRELIESLNQIGKLEGDAVSKQRPEFNQLVAQYKEIGHVPRKHEKSVQNGFNEARKQFDRALSAGELAQRAAASQHLFNLSQLCAELEAAVLDGKPIDALVEQWQALSTQGGDAPEAMQKRYDQAIAADQGDGFNAAELEANLEAKQALCLKLEVHYDMASPSDFQQQRMAYQIERLAASMKKDTGAQPPPEELITTLLCQGAVPAAQRAALQTRIQTCFERHIKA